jgi:mevalonate pyrophosphate decarboxylase
MSEIQKFYTTSENGEISSLYIEAISPINIALIKYWGKIDNKLIIPANDSLSITLDSSDLCSRTKISLLNPAYFPES